MASDQREREISPRSLRSITSARRASLPDASLSDFVNRLEITKISLMGLAAAVDQSTSEWNEEITSRTRLGFIELGYLGSRNARRTVAAGFPVIV